MITIHVKLEQSMKAIKSIHAFLKIYCTPRENVIHVLCGIIEKLLEGCERQLKEECDVCDAASTCEDAIHAASEQIDNSLFPIQRDDD